MIEKYKLQLKNVLDQLEADTGYMFRLTMRQYGSFVDSVIGDFHNRNLGVEVYKAKAAYADLIGVYDNVRALKNKITELDNYSETKLWTDSTGNIVKIGKCANCNTYNDDRKDGGLPNIVGKMPSCKTAGCCGRSFGKWNYV